MPEGNVEVDPDKLTVSLAARLAAIVPPGFHVRAADGMLWYSSDEGRFPGQLSDYRVGEAGTYVRVNFDAHEDESDADRIAWVGRQALDELQDFVDEATHDPWPGTVSPPRAYAQVRGEMLHLRYGGPDIGDDAVLACEPIPLASMQPVPKIVEATARRPRRVRVPAACGG
jgi:hypothetical protein